MRELGGRVTQTDQFTKAGRRQGDGIPLSFQAGSWRLFLLSGYKGMLAASLPSAAFCVSRSFFLTRRSLKPSHSLPTHKP